MSNSSDSFWDNPSTYSQWNDPDGEMARRYHEVHGEWPKGSRQRWEQDRRDDEERRSPLRKDAHPYFTEEFGRILAQLRASWFGMKVSKEVFETMNAKYLAEELAYAIEAFVLKEELPPEHITGETIAPTMTLHLGPATWRDFWKLTHGHRWWARWWVRRHPARIIEHPLTARHRVGYELTTGQRFRLYPHADVKIKDKLGRGYIHVPIPTPMRVTWFEQIDEVI